MCVCRGDRGSWCGCGSGGVVVGCGGGCVVAVVCVATVGDRECVVGVVVVCDIVVVDVVVVVVVVVVCVVGVSPLTSLYVMVLAFMLLPWLLPSRCGVVVVVAITVCCDVCVDVVATTCIVDIGCCRPCCC